MTKKILLILVLCLNLFGCQLAKEYQGDKPFEDQLMGVYITFDYIDSLDVEAYLNDHLNNKLSETKDYSQRIYANYDESYEDFYDFGIDGILFANLSYKENGHDVYRMSGSQYINHKKIDISEKKDSIEGTIYLESDTNTIAYLNPVYKTPENQVYLLSGSGISSNDDFKYSSWITETYTTKIANKEEEKTFEVKVNIEKVIPSDWYLIKQFDEKDQLIHSKRIDLDNIPLKLSKDKLTSYLIIEDYKKGKVVDKRFLYDEESFSLYAFDEFVAAKSYYVQLETDL